MLKLTGINVNFYVLISINMGVEVKSKIHDFSWLQSFNELIQLCMHVCAESCLTLLRPHRLWPARLLCPWKFPGKNTGKVKVKVTQSCLTLCDPMDSSWNSPGPRILEWVAFPFSRVSSWPVNQTGVFCIAGGFFTNWAIREAQEHWSWLAFPTPGNLPDPGMEPTSPAVAGGFFTTALPGLPQVMYGNC